MCCNDRPDEREAGGDGRRPDDQHLSNTAARRVSVGQVRDASPSGCRHSRRRGATGRSFWCRRMGSKRSCTGGCANTRVQPNQAEGVPSTVLIPFVRPCTPAGGGFLPSPMGRVSFRLSGCSRRFGARSIAFKNMLRFIIKYYNVWLFKYVCIYIFKF
jgi:hypothetical protein